MRNKKISKVFIASHADHGSKIGEVKHSNGGHVASPRRIEAHDKNEVLRATIHSLETILEAGLARDAHVGVGDWRREPTVADLPPELRDLSAPHPEQFTPEPLGLLERLSPDARAHHAEAVETGAVRYHEAVADWERAQARQAQALANLRSDVQEQNRLHADLESALKAGEPAAAEWYAAEVLKKSPYPKRLERREEVVLVGATGNLNVRMWIPAAGHVVPAVETYKYLKATDEIKEIDRSPEERAAIYERVVAQLILRSLHEIFSTDMSGAISTVALSVMVVDVDPSTGRDKISPMLSLAVTRSEFDEIDLARVDPIACLQRLTATAP